MDISSPAAWLIRQGRHAPDMGTLVRDLCGELNRQGFDLLRCTTQMQALHPQVAWRMFFWRRREVRVDISAARVVDMQSAPVEDGMVESVSIGHGALTEAFKRSPQFRMMTENLSTLRCRIDPAATTYEFPILKDLQAAGGTDYLAMLLDFTGTNGSFCSFVTRKPGGFTDADIQALLDMADPLSMCVQLHAGHHVAESLLQTYVGRQAGARVLAGQVQRGDVSRVNAAIWFSDMRGFTQLSGTVDSAVFIGWLNDYFGAIAKPVTDHGGEILKFIGDAVLAVFPVDEKHTAAEQCAAAVAAARASNAALDALNARRATEGLAPLNHGVGLHVGEVQYGNIGAERRLDFTVIGPAVNMTSRLEGLCGKLGRRLVVSADVHAHAGQGLVELGEFELKGITGAQKVYGDA